jgi:hypothetical protein
MHSTCPPRLPFSHQFLRHFFHHPTLNISLTSRPAPHSHQIPIRRESLLMVFCAKSMGLCRRIIESWTKFSKSSVSQHWRIHCGDASVTLAHLLRRRWAPCWYKEQLHKCTFGFSSYIETKLSKAVKLNPLKIDFTATTCLLHAHSRAQPRILTRKYCEKGPRRVSHFSTFTAANYPNVPFIFMNVTTSTT